MKSQEKVKRQRRIKSIAPYCNNPIGKETRKLQDAIARGLIILQKPAPIKVDHSAKRHMIKRINRTSN